MNVYFAKELVSNSFIVLGKPVPFEVLAGNRGVIILDSERDAALIAELSKAVQKQRGGITSITEAQYHEKKKSHPYSESELRSKQQRNLLQLLPSAQTQARVQPGKPAAAGAGNDNGKAGKKAPLPGEASIQPSGSTDPMATAFRPTTSRLRLTL